MPDSNDDYEDVLKHKSELKVEYMGTKLAPTVFFYRLCESLPNNYHKDHAIIRLGIISHQLHEYSTDLHIDGNGQISFGEFEVTPETELGKVTEYAQRIQRGLNGGEDMIINQRQFPTQVYTTVADFLSHIETEVSDRRLDLSERYCKVSGLAGPTDTDTDADNNDKPAPHMESPQTGETITVVSNEHYI